MGENLDKYFNTDKQEGGSESGNTEIIDKICGQLESGVKELISYNDSPELLEALNDFAVAFEGVCWRGEGGLSHTPKTKFQLNKLITFLKKAEEELR